MMGSGSELPLSLIEGLDGPAFDESADIWDFAQDFLVHATYEGAVIRMNAPAVALLGGLLPIDPEAPGATQAALHAMRETGKPVRLSAPVETVEGDQRHISWSIAPHPSGLSFFAIGRDTTASMEARQRLRETEERLIQMQQMETLGQLAGGVAHDFNNLLVPILNVLELVAKRPQEDPDFDELVKGARRAAISARTTVRRILSFAQQGKSEPAEIDVASLLAGMQDLLVQILPASVTLEVETDPGLPRVRLHANQLELSIVNLAINAADAMPEGGVLRIAARHEAAGVRISVSDNGTGMDSETVSRATEPFYTTKGVGKGTGLGLFMANRLAHRSGGRLEIQSVQGEGTTVALDLPAAG